jgi:hypothetical protein
VKEATMLRRDTEYHRHTLDGVNYQITVEPCGKGYVGKWTCGACPATGGSSSLYRSPNETLEQAKVNLFTHHACTHRPENRPGSS